MPNNQKGVAHIFVILFLIFTLGIGLYLVQRPQIFAPKAAEFPQPRGGSGDCTLYDQNGNCVPGSELTYFRATQNPCNISAAGTCTTTISWDICRNVTNVQLKRNDKPNTVLAGTCNGTMQISEIPAAGVTFELYGNGRLNRSLFVNGSSVSSNNNTVAGVNSGNEIYIWNEDSKSFSQIPGALKQLSVGPLGQIWGVAGNDSIYYRADNGQFIMVEGSLKQVEVGCDGSIIGTTRGDEVYFRKSTITPWQRLSGSLKYATIGNQEMWGVNSNDEIFYRPNTATEWQKVTGNLKQIDVSCDGTVWGVTSNDEIYARFGIGGQWTKVAGSLKQVSVTKNEVWGVNRADEIYHYVTGRSWEKVPGALKHISVQPK